MPAANAPAFAFLAARQSQPAKLFAGPVPNRAELEPILTAALRVPDHGKLEPWRLVVLRSWIRVPTPRLYSARPRPSRR